MDPRMCLNLNYDAAGTNLIRSKYDSLLVFPSQPFGECVCVCVCVCVLGLVLCYPYVGSWLPCVSSQGSW